MSRLEAVLGRAVADLRRAGASFALIGGLAVSARAEPRFTRDADLAVSVTDDREAEEFVQTLRRQAYGLVAAVDKEATGRLATVRLQPAEEPAAGVVLDLLFASSGIEPEIVAAAETLHLTSALELPIARTGHLIAARGSARGRDLTAALERLLA